VKTIFFGTSSFAVPSLRVVAGRTELTAVVTQPDRPAGRGHRLKPTPVKSVAVELGLRVYEPARLREFALEISGQGYDLFVLASYGRILPAKLLEVPKFGALNVHPSLLPRYRGATPIQSAIANGEADTGVSIMLMDSGLDTGEIVMQESLAIEPGETYGELHDRLARFGAEILGRVLDVVRQGELPHHPQHGDATLTRPLSKEDLVLDLSLPPQRIVDIVRAFSPQPGARATFGGETVKVLRAHVAHDGGLVIDELIAPNRGKMTGDEYRRMRNELA
jgi:methionyl-tRNA formyltransferase